MCNLILKAKIIEKIGSQTVFARLLGVTEDRLSKIIHGRLSPQETERKLIAQKLGVPEGELFPDYEGLRPGGAPGL